MSSNRSGVLLGVVMSAAMFACGGALPSVPPVPAAPAVPAVAAPVAAVPASAAPESSAPSSAQASANEGSAKDEARPAADADAPDAEQGKAKAPAPPPPPETVDAPGKLLTKPSKGKLQVEVAANQPVVGDEAELSRMIDRSVPLFGGGWIVIAKTRVVKVDGKKVTLEVLEEQAKMKINGKKLDHFTPGVAIRLKFARNGP